jgi:hypothetical protein
MIDRKEFAETLLLREQVRKAIKIVGRQRQERLKNMHSNEFKLRQVIRTLLKESTGVADSAKHNNTGINALEDLLKNTNVLSVLETGYKSLTTDDQQRESYRNHILSAVKRALAPEESRKEGGGDLTEDIDIEIGDPKDDPDFIDVEDKEEISDEAAAKEGFALAGEDKTGRNRAFTDFQDIEKVILVAFDDLDNPIDLQLFEEYLIKNLALYFDKFEGELDVNVEAPPEAEDAEPDAGVEAAAEEEEMALGGEDEEEIATIELQEVIKHLNLDDIIENLL